MVQAGSCPHPGSVWVAGSASQGVELPLADLTHASRLACSSATM